ncbi:hypothetical protein [Shewanella sp. FJAT-52076]|uniref:hypothetical protein n=1 Tax=Shewanella sp. FJAT-52076 TaxID=2864202 RepID=UPI001C657D12|nr:hypothetical protein [Shewanella sp. FJAT-52076]QYJ76959.1 hypothetical protein K0H79_08435 [Shewanella sp. FJAT-52076]
MSNFKKVLIVFAVLVGLGTIAGSYNESRHMEMALAECGSKDKIANVDSEGFECKKT